MAPLPKLLTPAEVHARTGLTIAPNEVAYHEGAAVIVFPSGSPGASASTSAQAAAKAAELTPGQGADAAAFVNPMQEFNRDLSIAAIRTWEADMNAEIMAKRLRGWYKKYGPGSETRGKGRGRKGKGKGKAPAEPEPEQQQEQPAAEEDEDAAMNGPSAGASGSTANAVLQPPKMTPYRFTILEALAATGLRSIRYAKEIDNVRWILANDISASAIESMRRNVDVNFPLPENATQEAAAEADGQQAQHAEAEGASAAPPGEAVDADTAMADEPAADAAANPAKLAKKAAAAAKARIRINEGDAMSVMYSHRTPAHMQFDVIDLDPYGSAGMFLDGAVQSVSEGGLLCITCTDLAVLAGGQYPEKAFSTYGGASIRAEYSHEIALRLVLHAIATAAARYGRAIQPLLSLSIDFYVRVFVRVHSSAADTKRVASQVGVHWSCQGCGNAAGLPMGRIRPGPPSRDGKAQEKHSPAQGPPIGPKCDECGSSWAMAGPMWTGPLHDTGFCRRLLATVNKEPHKFKTASRIRGMVGTAAMELGNSDLPAPGSEQSAETAELAAPAEGEGDASEASAPEDAVAPLFYFTPPRFSSAFHSLCPPIAVVVHALLNAGYQVSRSHCLPGSLKTNCPRPKLIDLHRTWLKAQQDAGVIPGEDKAEESAATNAEAAQAEGSSTPAESAPAGEAVDPSRKLRLSKRVRKLPPSAPAYQLNSKPIQTLWDITSTHPDAAPILSADLDSASWATRADEDGSAAADSDAGGSEQGGKKGKKKDRVIRYPANPQPHWGPGTAAKTTVAPLKPKIKDGQAQGRKGGKRQFVESIGDEPQPQPQPEAPLQQEQDLDEDEAANSASAAKKAKTE